MSAESGEGIIGQFMERSQKTVQTSVRSLVEFILRSGDLDSRRGGWADRDAMAAGSRIHRKIQQRRGGGYVPEVPLRYERDYGTYTLVIEGRADGIWRVSRDAAGDMKDLFEADSLRETADACGGEAVLIEEIKGVYADLARIEEPVPVHLAQAMCYAHIYGSRNGLREIFICMTYVNMESELEKKFVRAYDAEELETWFEDLLAAYHQWAGFQVDWTDSRNASMQGMEFPFAYRPGQREMVVDIYRTVLRRKQLFVQAPTGIGKTMSAVFPSVRAMGEGYGDKIFYLTAKTVTRTVAEEAFAILRGYGLQLKSLTITSKEKICVLDEPDCNPAACPRARGHFDRVNQAVWELLNAQNGFGREDILRQAEKWNVCPFEMQLDLSYFMDAVICDYNYVFDPRARLKRFFSDGAHRGEWIFLIDEAHNLVERGREMFSAGLYREEIKDAGAAAAEELRQIEELTGTASRGLGRKKRKKNKKTGPDGQLSLFDSPEVTQSAPGSTEIDVLPSGERELQAYAYGRRDRKKLEELRLNLIRFRTAARRCAGILLEYRREQEGEQSADPDENGGRAEGQNERDPVSKGALRERTSIEEFAPLLMNLSGILEEILPDLREGECRKELLSFFFSVCSFLDTYELMDENYIIYTEITGDGRYFLKLFCVNPAVNLQACLDRGRSAVFYSATLLPVGYYRSLLSARKDDYAVYIRSPFDPANRVLLIGRDVSSVYKRRGPGEYRRFAAYIREMTAARSGNYMVFLPSYKMLEEIGEEYQSRYADEGTRCLLQKPSMTEAEREAFLAAFRENEQGGAQERTLVGFCVMGGIFSEGIDLYGDRLIGAAVIGTGIPQIGEERELLRRYYDRNGKSGFDYAYRFPGMNKVQQAAGRVIRTTEDTGVILLLDERFSRRENRELFPAEWADARLCVLQNAGDEIRGFWNCHKNNR